MSDWSTRWTWGGGASRPREWTPNTSPHYSITESGWALIPLWCQLYSAWNLSGAEQHLWIPFPAERRQVICGIADSPAWMIETLQPLQWSDVPEGVVVGAGFFMYADDVIVLAQAVVALGALYTQQGDSIVLKAGTIARVNAGRAQ